MQPTKNIGITSKNTNQGRDLVPLGEGGIKGGLGYPAIVNELVPPKGQIKNCGRYVFWKNEARLKGYRNKYKNKHKKKSDETNLGV